MTAEIAILNKEAIALASDSAVTLSGDSSPKIFTSANKLFSLSKYHPVGIMLYQNALFMGVPWEVIIKLYRNKLGLNKFDKLEDYSDDFIRFLGEGNSLFPAQIQDQHVIDTISNYLLYLRSEIFKLLEKEIESEKGLTEEAIQKSIALVVKRDYDMWNSTDNIPTIPESHEDEILRKYGNDIRRLLQDTFENLPLTKNCKKYLERIACLLFSKFPSGIRNPDFSGVVIAGFGELDTFPVLDEFLLEGIALDKLKYKRLRTERIDLRTSAAIIPFAQREMVDTFMQGVDPSYLKVEEGFLNDIFDSYAAAISRNLQKYTPEEQEKLKDNLVSAGKDILDDFKNKLESHRKVKYIDPVTNVVSFLPKDELAAMAESLVNLTSFKRKVTMESETVGGPVDVALISKGDGFIWIKRKHYFKAELNPQFFANYYRGGGDERTQEI